jgi:hypothetical protein
MCHFWWWHNFFYVFYFLEKECVVYVCVLYNHAKLQGVMLSVRLNYEEALLLLE